MTEHRAPERGETCPECSGPVDRHGYTACGALASRLAAAEATIGELRKALETLLNEIDEERDGGSEYLDQGYWHTTLLAEEEFHWVNFIKAALAAALLPPQEANDA